MAKLLLLSTMAVASTVAGCSSTDNTAGDSDDLTSLTARSRALQFDGVLYVDPAATDAQILSQVQRQTQTAFGALRTAEIGVNTRELKTVDTKTFKKRPVTLVDGATQKPMIEVRYTYTDNAVVPVSMAKRSTIGLAVMGPDYTLQTSRILKECTANDDEAREFQSSIWYVFDPSIRSCSDAISKELKAIGDARAKLSSPNDQIVPAELNRLYLPITVSLGPDKTNKGKSFPEYDRLFSGGVQKGKVVVGLVNGLIDHGDKTTWNDSGLFEWMSSLREVFKARPDFKLVKTEPKIDLSTITLKSGKKVTGLSLDKFIQWKLDGTGQPQNLSGLEQNELQELVGDALAGKWFTFETKASVQIGSAAPKDLTLSLFTFFGSDRDSTPHKRGIKESDVFLYNGHSYIGFGPLDPNNFSKKDFPSSYQILFIDGCVSYNYYEKDYIPLKDGGTANLDLITNGLEAPSGDSGEALGRFISLLWSGKQASYKDLLSSARATDSLRVVDGELDNVYSPTKTPIMLK